MMKNWKAIVKIVVVVLTALLGAVGGATASGVQFQRHEALNEESLLSTIARQGFITQIMQDFDYKQQSLVGNV